MVSQEQRDRQKGLTGWQKELTALHMEMTISMYLGMERKVSVSTFTKLYNTDIISEEQDSTQYLPEHHQYSNKSTLILPHHVDKNTNRPSIHVNVTQICESKSDHTLM